MPKPVRSFPFPENCPHDALFEKEEEGTENVKVYG